MLTNEEFADQEADLFISMGIITSGQKAAYVAAREPMLNSWMVQISNGGLLKSIQTLASNHQDLLDQLSVIRWKGTVANVSSLPAEGLAGDAWIALNTLHVHIRANETWVDIGSIKGEPGADARQDLIIPLMGSFGAGQKVFTLQFSTTVTFAAVDCKAYAGVAPTGNCSFVLKRNGVNWGTVSFTAGSKIGTVSITGSAFIEDDVLDVYEPVTHDATLADVTITLVEEDT